MIYFTFFTHSHISPIWLLYLFTYLFTYLFRSFIRSHIHIFIHQRFIHQKRFHSLFFTFSSGEESLLSSSPKVKKVKKVKKVTPLVKASPGSTKAEPLVRRRKPLVNKYMNKYARKKQNLWVKTFFL